MNRLFILLMVVFGVGCKSTQTLVKDQNTVSMIAQGKGMLANRQYKKAALVLESASIRPFNQGTTTALYLAGLAYYYNGEGFAAEQQFDKLMRGYPESKYIEDAKYHKALIHLDKFSDDIKKNGLESLFILSNEAKSKEIRENALKAAQEFAFFKGKEPFLKKYMAGTDRSSQKVIVEGLVYRLVSNDKRGEAKTMYAEYLKGGGPESSFVGEIFTEEKPQEVFEPNIMKIGMFLPLYLDDVPLYGLSKIPERSETALNFYEGFQKAVEDYGILSGKKIYLKLFDSRRDSFRINFFLKDFEKFRPDLVVGDVYTDASKALSRWAKVKKVAHVVPFSSNPSLIQDSSGYTFLARPSAGTHGKRMAEYAAIDLGLQHVVTWTDGRRFTEMISKAFIQTFEMYGGKVEVMRIDSVYKDRAQEDIMEHFKTHLKSWEGIDGVYIPLSNEESASLILTTMRVQIKPADGYEVRAMGTPSWQSFNLLSQREKEYFNLLFTDSYAPKNDSVGYLRYYNYHFREFNRPPSKENVQGYGLGMYLLKMLDMYKPEEGSFPDYLRKALPYRTVHSDFHYLQKQDNQSLHILEYRDGEMKKVK